MMDVGRNPTGSADVVALRSRRPRRGCLGRRNGEERGTSLIELMVVVALLAVVLPIGFQAVSSVQQSAVGTTYRFRATAQGQLMLDTLTRQIRAAVPPPYVPGENTSPSGPILWASSSELQFYSAVGNANGPVLMGIYAVPSCGGGVTDQLVEYQVDPAVTNNGTVSYGTLPAPQSCPVSGPSATERIVLGTNLLLTPPSPSSGCPTASTTNAGFQPGLFEYFDKAGSCLHLGAGTGDTASLAPVESVSINVRAEVTTKGTLAALAPPTALVAHVNLANVDGAG